MRRHAEDGSCSAWATRSAATNGTSAVSSASTQTSDGPAGKSMSTLLRSIILAPVTNTFPGPTIFWTGSIVSVPSAIAAMACAPPVLYISSTPAISAATSTRGLMGAGVHMTTSSTPATLAGMAVMSTVLGYDALPPGM